MKKIALMFVAIMMLAGTLSVSAQTAESKVEEQIKMVKAETNISEAVVTKVRPILLASAKSIDVVLADKSTTKAAKVASFKGIFDTESAEMKKVLTDSQYAKYLKLQDRQVEMLRDKVQKSPAVVSSDSSSDDSGSSDDVDASSIDDDSMTLDQRVDSMLEKFKKSWKLTDSQLPLVRAIIYNTTVSVDKYRLDESKKATEKIASFESIYAKEGEEMKKVLDDKQYRKYQEWQTKRLESLKNTTHDGKSVSTSGDMGGSTDASTTEVVLDDPKMTIEQRVEVLIQKLKKEYSLSDDLINQGRPIMVNTAKGIDALMKDSGKKGDAKNSAFKAIIEKDNADMSKILTEAQLAKYKKLQESRFAQFKARNK
jgi:hypothetical protein